MNRIKIYRVREIDNIFLGYVLIYVWNILKVNRFENCNKLSLF